MSQNGRSKEEIYGLGQEVYDQRIAPTVETEENIGKIIVIDVDTGDYEIDKDGITASKRLRARHPDAVALGLRIGYDAVEAFGGAELKRIKPPLLAPSPGSAGRA